MISKSLVLNILRGAWQNIPSMVLTGKILRNKDLAVSEPLLFHPSRTKMGRNAKLRRRILPSLIKYSLQAGRAQDYESTMKNDCTSVTSYHNCSEVGFTWSRTRQRNPNQFELSSLAPRRLHCHK